MTIKKRLSVIGTTTAGFFSAATMVLAQENPIDTPINAADSGFKITDLGKLIQGLLNMVLIIAALLVLVYLIWGGIQWITSGGDKGKTEEARNKITAAIIGLGVVAAAYAIYLTITYFLGIENATDIGGALEGARPF